MAVDMQPRQPQATTSPSPTVSLVSTTTTSASTLSTTPSTSPVSITSLPTGYDTAPGGLPSGISTPTASSASASASSSSSSDNSGGLVNYYFVFLALILCIAAIAGALVWRRRRIIAGRGARRYGHGRSGTASAPGFVSSGSARQPWLGRWRSAEVSREEGLNEDGEAPPPYMPKSDEEPGIRDDRHARSVTGQEHTHTTPAVPLQTLSREDVGFKPPEYQHHVREVSSIGHDPQDGGQGSSHNPT